MADPEGTESEESLAEWRKEMKAKVKAGEDAMQELTKAQQRLAIYDAKLGDLNDDQRTAVLALAGDDLSEEVLKAKAQSLGFVKNETQSQSTQGQQPQPGSQGQQFLQNQAEAFDRLDDAASGVSTPPNPEGLMERIAAAQGDQAKVTEILAQAGMLEQY